MNCNLHSIEFVKKYFVKVLQAHQVLANIFSKRNVQDIVKDIEEIKTELYSLQSNASCR